MHVRSGCWGALLDTTRLQIQVDITNTDEPIEVEWTYSVDWQEDDTRFTARMERLAGGGFLPDTFEVRHALYFCFVCSWRGRDFSSMLEGHTCSRFLAFSSANIGKFGHS